MTVAFRTYQLCPPDQRPAGIPLSYPWIQRDCTDEEAPLLVRQGWSVLPDSDYTDYIASQDDALTTYLASRSQIAVEKIINDAMAFGVQCLREFSAENVLMGITAANMTGTVLTLLQGVLQALLAGSLYEAINRIRAVNPTDYDGTFLNATRVLKFINKIEAYLGIPLSESV